MNKGYAIYALPGLGLNRHIYDQLHLDYSYQVLEWKEPHHNEQLSDYALRYCSEIKSSSDTVILIGHSFGGVLAQEIAQRIKIDRIVLISSIKSSKELPFSFNAMRILKLHHLVSRRSILGTFPLWAQSNGYHTEALKAIFKESVNSLSDDYLKWALKNLTHWKGCPEQCTIYHIHGTKDKTFPIKYISTPDLIISDGDHLLVYSKAYEIAKAINRILK